MLARTANLLAPISSSLKNKNNESACRCTELASILAFIDVLHPVHNGVSRILSGLAVRGASFRQM